MARGFSRSSGFGGAPPRTAADESAAARWRARWRALPPRERRLALLAAFVLVAALTWMLLIAPALSTLRTAGEKHRTLDAQLAQMRQLGAQAQALASQPRANPDEAVRALETSVREILGAASRLQIAGDRATLTLAGVPPDRLAQWLVQARVNARTLPTDAKLARGADGNWSGNLTLALPPR